MGSDENYFQYYLYSIIIIKINIQNFISEKKLTFLIHINNLLKYIKFQYSITFKRVPVFFYTYCIKMQFSYHLVL